MTFNVRLLILVVGFGLAASAVAVQTSSVREDDYNVLAQGELKSVALTSDGYLLASYARREVGGTGTEIVWDAIEEPAGTVLCATGHAGRLVRILDEKTSRTVAQLPDPELTAMVRLEDGSVLIAGAPSGTIYRLGAKDTLTTFTRLNANFVWRMARDEDGYVWAATGSDGRLFRMSASAEVREVHKFGSSNLLDLWIDKDGVMGDKGLLYVAGQNPGLLYRMNPSKAGHKPEVVFDSQAEEIRALLPLKDGLALALNTDRAPTPVALQLTMRMTGNPSAPPVGEPPRPELGKAFAPARERQYGQPRSQVVVLDKLGYQRELWTSPERAINGLAAGPDDSILVAAGSQGRVFEVTPDGHSSIVVDLRDDFVVSLRSSGKRCLLTTARNGTVVSLGRERAGEAVFVSRPIDAKVPVRWGKFYVNGLTNGKSKVLVEFRLGNDADPDSELWGDWSRQSGVSSGEPVAMPRGVARYAQYRLSLRQRGSEPLRIDWAELFYVEPNRPPRVGSIKMEPYPLAPGQSQPAAGATPGARPAAATAGKSIERQPRSNLMLYKLSWAAGDPNHDELIYSIYYKARDEEEWKLIAEDAPFTSIDRLPTGLMADGNYRFKVVASDKRANAPGEALSGEKVSDEVVIDNAPPAIERLRADVGRKGARIHFDAVDAVSNIAAAKYDLNNKNECSLQPVDDILDQRREQFEADTGRLEPGEYVATISVTDREGNTAVQKVVFTISK
ncbi:MAG: fibronectin type III domain-containing protein [Candidatus Sumerlaeia bacterium]